jgi:hypothetical protein
LPHFFRFGHVLLLGEPTHSNLFSVHQAQLLSNDDYLKINRRREIFTTWANEVLVWPWKLFPDGQIVMHVPQNRQLTTFFF